MRRPETLGKGRRRGTVLIILMVLLLVTISIAIAVMQAALVDSRQFSTDAKALQADRLAEAGLSRATALRTADPDLAGDDWTVELPGGATGSVSSRIKETPGRLIVESVATFPATGVQRVRSRRSVILAQPTP
ncbi:MAG: hypothetical protein M3552_19100 [Planctomycetota bacterium]|nr:hypothetical protein [Planctomycetaceae bacterium]MDQ3332724.1 hypothetical protein [Planctomycetota bacterium]